MGGGIQQDWIKVRVTCPLCRNQETVEFRTANDNNLYYRCPGCETVSRDSSCRLSPENEKKRYELHRNNSEDNGYIRWINSFLDFALDPAPPSGSVILDYGSGPEPVMASMMEERGYRVFIEDTYFAPGKPEGPFDIITSLEVFEHLNHPYDVLIDLKSRLAPGGRLCISTEFLPAEPDQFESWQYRSDITHIGFFTQKGLADAAARAGLMEDGCDGIRYIAFRLARRGTSC